MFSNADGTCPSPSNESIHLPKSSGPLSNLKELQITLTSVENHKTNPVRSQLVCFYHGSRGTQKPQDRTTAFRSTLSVVCQLYNLPSTSMKHLLPLLHLQRIPLSAKRSALGHSHAPRTAFSPAKWRPVEGSTLGRLRHLSTMPQSSEVEKAVSFVMERGHREKVAQRVVETLLRPGTGISSSTIFATVKAMAGAYEIGEDAGLNRMAQAVELEIARSEGKKVITFCVQTPRGGSSFECQGYEDMSLQDVVEFGELENNDTLQEYIECACSGIMACSTCHVVVDPAWYEAVGVPSEEEQDMIDLAYDPQPTSRLGCQIVLSEKLDGLKITIPDDSNNLMDHIPFKD